MLDTNGDLENIDLISGFVGWRHVFKPRLRGNLDRLQTRIKYSS
ncbi:hypothetical protein J2X06_000261 [Lysobacter niastensis]|uniref:Uncharacterized protein n=1 Tax=Lysobacter niastensis TaxID=380629 RepID=A0ABU1W654_9GAMM|nr:hypothetical protein [Lysobacter niastensis]MDR7133077.1 hypothetical protein [Lysobacter niastensis]